MRKSEDNKLKILHLINISLPKLAGYTIRTHNILKFQKKFVKVYALTDPNSFRMRSPDIIDDIPYFHNLPNILSKILNELKVSKKLRIDKIYQWLYNSVFKFTDSYISYYIHKIRPDIIHIHSSPLFGKYGGAIAHKYNIPFIYEIRGFLEETHIGLGNFKRNSYEFRKRKERRSEITKKADAIVTLGTNMKNELINQGVKQRKIHIVPNAVDISQFSPTNPDISLKKKITDSNNFLVGFIGSIRKIEGIEVILKALKEVKKEISKIKVLLIGPYNPVYFHELKSLVERLDIQQSVIFVGRIPHSEIQNYYSILDICIIPRLNLRVNRLVTPLKPLEVMAMGKLLITSDLPALRELVKPKISGDIFQPGNYKELAEKILYYYNHKDEVEEISTSARKYVVENYNWNNIIIKYIDLYQNLIEK